MVRVVYISRKKRKTGLGVRGDHLWHMILPEKRRMGLLFSSPCTCGSLSHGSTKNLNCLLNKQYMDASVSK